MPKMRIINTISNTVAFTGNSITYVDDISHANAITRDETIHQQATVIALELTSDLRVTAQESEKALHVSGGDYSLSKCHFSTMTHKWLPSGASTLHLIAETPANLSIAQGSNTTLVPISRKEPHESCRTLGCHIAIDGNSKTQEKVLWTAATLAGAGMRHRVTTKVDAYMEYKSFIFPALSFSLGATGVDQPFLSEIERRYLRPTKQQLGFRYTVASAIMFAPRAYMGMDIDSLSISSDIQHIRMLCGHLLENGPISKSILATISMHQIQSGMTEPILHCSVKYSNWVEPGWIETCWHALQRFNITLKYDSFTCPPLLRQNDKCLMTLFADSGIFKPFHLRKLNRSRIWLNVTTVSDVATTCGLSLNKLRYLWKMNTPTTPTTLENSPSIGHSNPTQMPNPGNTGDVHSACSHSAAMTSTSPPHSAPG
jgi:hypothetical protein